MISLIPLPRTNALPTAKPKKQRWQLSGRALAVPPMAQSDYRGR